MDIGHVLRYFQMVFVARDFPIVAGNDGISLNVASSQRLFVAGCQITAFALKISHQT